MPRILAILLAVLVSVLLVLALRRGEEADGDMADRRDAAREPTPLRGEEVPRVVRPSLVGRGKTNEAHSEEAATAVAVAAGQGVALRGIALDPEGEPRAGSTVMLKQWVPRTRSDGVAVRVEETVGTRRTGGAGVFRFEGLEPGSYDLEALAPPGLLAPRASVQLGANGADISLSYRRAMEVRVHVETPEGAPVEGARVSFGSSSSRTTAEGIAVLRHVDPEHAWALDVAPPFDRRGELRSAQLLAWTPRDATIVLLRCLTVSGRVVDEKDRPYAGASVAIQRAGQESWSSRESEADGTFSFPGLRPGAVMLRAEPPGTALAPNAMVVTVEAGQSDVELVVQRGVSLTVVISNWPATEELPSASIRLTPGNRPEAARTFRLNADGTAEATGLEAGVEYILWGNLPRMPDRYLYLPRVIPTGEPCHVELREGGMIQGVVKFPPSTFPQSPAFRGPGVNGRGVVDPRSGEFELRGVPPGTWTVVAYASKFGVSRHPIKRRDLWWAEGEAVAGDDDVRLELEPYKE